MELLINGAPAPEGVILRPVVNAKKEVLGFIPIKGHPLNEEIRKELKIVFSTFEDHYTFKSMVVPVYTSARTHNLRFPSDEYLVIEGRVYEDDAAAEAYGFIYDEDDEEWVQDIVDNGCFNASSHSLERKVLTNSKYKVGFEIEKEDTTQQRVSYVKLYKDTKWCKEEDGSLGSGGYELVSPVLPLFGNIEKLVEPVAHLINGRYSSNCGGHINISVEGKTATQIIDDIKGWLPILYSLYEDRTNNSYSQIRPIDEYKHSRGSKGSALTTKMNNNVLEIRLFPAVPNVKALLFRVRLLRYMLLNPLRNAAELDEAIAKRKFVRDLIINHNLTIQTINKFKAICA